jgi:hypothetical protein
MSFPDGIAMVARGSAEFRAMWDRLASAVIDGRPAVAPSAPCPETGEDWEYMGSVRRSNETVLGKSCGRCGGSGRPPLGSSEFERVCSWCGGEGSGVRPEWAHQFRHRCYGPAGHARVYVNVPATSAFRPDIDRARCMS